MISMVSFIDSLYKGYIFKFINSPKHGWGTLHVRQSLFIIMGVLSLSAALPFIATQQHLKWLPIILIGIFCILALIRWPEFGLVLLIVTTAIPYWGPSGITITMMFLAFLLCLWFLNMITFRGKIQFHSINIIRPILIFIVISSISLAMGKVEWFPFARNAPLGAQLGGWAIHVLSCSALLLVAHQIGNLRWLKAITWIFIFIASLFIIGRTFHPLESYISALGRADSLLWVWLTAMAFSQALLNKKLKIVWRLILVAISAITIYAGLIQNPGWKSGWIPPLVTIITIIGLRYWRIGITLIFIGALPAWYIGTQVIASDAYSISTRIDAWLILAEIIKENPILGLGFSNYYWYTPLFLIRGYSVVFNSHNQYVDLIAQTGIVGLICFFWIFAEISRFGWKIINSAPSGFASAYVYGAMGGLFGTLAAGLLGDWVLPFFYNIGLGGFRASVYPWIFLGGLISLNQLIGNTKNEKEIIIPYGEALKST